MKIFSARDVEFFKHDDFVKHDVSENIINNNDNFSEVYLPCNDLLNNDISDENERISSIQIENQTNNLDDAFLDHMDQSSSNSNNVLPTLCRSS